MITTDTKPARRSRKSGGTTVDPAVVRPACTPEMTAATGVSLPQPEATTPATSKLDLLAALLAASGGASIAAMVAATGWQAHSVRGAMAGALRTRGLVITSAKVDGVRVYSTVAAA